MSNISNHWQMRYGFHWRRYGFGIGFAYPAGKTNSGTLFEE
jgi:hypothetical protein